jgi:Cu+-exporting ATPase
MRMTEDNVNTVSAVVYTAGASLVAAIVFVLTIVADYGWVARIGGAGWVFMLSMVILMPIVPSLLRERARADGEPSGAGPEAIMQEGSNMLVKDLVCGMEIDSATAAGSSEYEGQTYYFCNLNCKKEFDADPARYVSN